MQTSKCIMRLCVHNKHRVMFDPCALLQIRTCSIQKRSNLTKLHWILHFKMPQEVLLKGIARTSYDLLWKKSYLRPFYFSIVKLIRLARFLLCLLIVWHTLVRFETCLMEINVPICVIWTCNHRLANEPLVEIKRS